MKIYIGFYIFIVILTGFAMFIPSCTSSDFAMRSRDTHCVAGVPRTVSGKDADNEVNKMARDGIIKNTATTKLPPWDKGYCLYGYQMGNRTIYVLMLGTDSKKTFSEIETTTSFKSEGLAGGKALIDRIDSGQLFISDIRNSPDVDQATIPYYVSSAPAAEIKALKKYWERKRKTEGKKRRGKRRH